MKKQILTLILIVFLAFGCATVKKPSVFDRAEKAGKLTIDAVEQIAYLPLAGGTLTGAVNLTDDTDTHIIKAVQETGLGGRLTFGLDETARTMVICDAADVDQDFALTIKNEPTLYLFDTTGAIFSRYSYSGIYTTGFDMYIQGNQKMNHRLTGNISSGNAIAFFSEGAIALTDTDGEQSWVYIEPKINQINAETGAAGYNALQIKATETDIDTAASNNLIKAGTSVDDDMFAVDNTGRIILAETTTPAALVDHAFLYAKDVAGTGNMFVADAAADETQISSHNFTMFTPDPNERFPWSFYAENKALGVKMNVDMAGAIRAIEALTGKSFIYYEDLPKSVDLEATYREQWKKEWIKVNTQTVEVAKADALEMKDVEERVLYDIEKNGKIIKQPNQIDEKIIGYELVEGEVKPKIETIYEIKMVKKLSLKDGVEFSSADGKFYKKIIPTELMVEAAAVAGFVFAPPAWLKDRLKTGVIK